MLHGLYYADEVASFEDIEFGDEVQIRASELDLAQQLIEQLSSERFAPEKYEDATARRCSPRSTRRSPATRSSSPSGPRSPSRSST